VPVSDPIGFWPTVEGFAYAARDVAVVEPALVDELRAAARDAWSVYEAIGPLARALDTQTLTELGIPPIAHDAVRTFDPLCGETLVGRFDFIRAPDGDLRVIEFNAETPFCVVEHFAESGRRAIESGFSDPNAGCLEQLVRAIGRALGPLDASGHVGVTAYNVWREDIGTADFVRRLIAEHVDVRVSLIPIHELSVRGGRLVWNAERIDVLYRYYPLEHFARDRGAAAFFAALGERRFRTINPPSALLAQAKALGVLIWGLASAGTYLSDDLRALVQRRFLPAFAERPDDGEAYVRKPSLGREGTGVHVLMPDAPEPDGASIPCVYQRYVPMPERSIRLPSGGSVHGYELLTCFVVGGEPSAIGMRVGGRITDAWSHFVPLGVAA